MQKQRVILFGAGNCGQLIAKKIKDKEEILFFIDNDKEKWGKTIEIDNQKFVIQEPKSILQAGFERIILGTFTGLSELKEQLMSELGIPAEKIDTSHIELSVLARIAFLEDFAKVIKEKNLSGEVAELGVYRGDFARHINTNFPNKTLYLLDTFEGFSNEDVSKDVKMSKNLGARHFANTSVELVLNKMPYPEKCQILKGWFPQTTSSILEEKFCFVNLDCDLYEPILEGLRFFYPRMVGGGAILVHEYFSLGYVGVKKAVDLFIQEQKAVALPIGDNLSIAILKL